MASVLTSFTCTDPVAKHLHLFMLAILPDCCFVSLKRTCHRFQIMWMKCILITFRWLQVTPLGPVHAILKLHWECSRYLVELSKFPAAAPNKHKLGDGQPWKYLHNGCSTLQSFCYIAQLQLFRWREEKIFWKCFCTLV